MKKIIPVILLLFMLIISCGPRHCDNFEGLYVNSDQGITIEMSDYHYVVMTDGDMNGNMVELDKGRYELSSSCEFIPQSKEAYFVKIEIEENELTMLRRDGAELKFRKK